jgi:hypothetical protein
LDEVKIVGGQSLFYDPDGQPCSLRQYVEYTETRGRVMIHAWPNRTHVSTVYLGIDHGWGHTERPLIYETMVFGPDGIPEAYEDFTRRYSTFEEALAGHAEVVADLDPMVPGEPVELPEWRSDG